MAKHYLWYPVVALATFMATYFVIDRGYIPLLKPSITFTSPSTQGGLEKGIKGKMLKGTFDLEFKTEDDGEAKVKWDKNIGFEFKYEHPKQTGSAPKTFCEPRILSSDASSQYPSSGVILNNPETKLVPVIRPNNNPSSN